MVFAVVAGERAALVAARRQRALELAVHLDAAATLQSLIDDDDRLVALAADGDDGPDDAQQEVGPTLQPGSVREVGKDAVTQLVGERTEQSASERHAQSRLGFGRGVEAELLRQRVQRRQRVRAKVVDGAVLHAQPGARAVIVQQTG